jgi:outer membrane protein assembly factor BamB
MNRRSIPLGLGLLFVLFLIKLQAAPQSLTPKWKKDFPDRIDWYVRTSSGILLIKTGNSLAAVDAVDGRQFWTLPELQTSYSTRAILGYFPRGKDMLEVPGMGILLANRVRLPGDTEGRLIALNLMTGERLWDKPEIDDLVTLIPLFGKGQVVLASRKLQKKALALAASIPWGYGLDFDSYPFHFKFTCLDLFTGKTVWATEYPRLLNPGFHNLEAFGDQLFLQSIQPDKIVVGRIDSSNGNILWIDAQQLFTSAVIPIPSSASPVSPVPLEWFDDRLIYAAKNVYSVDPASQHVTWQIEKLGRITGLVAQNSFLVALGEKKIAAVDPKTGMGAWDRETHSNTTNLLWEKESDSLIYGDRDGIHILDRATGKTLKDIAFDSRQQHFSLRLGSPEVVIAIAESEVSGFNLRAGNRVLAHGKLKALCCPYSFLDQWPLPDAGQGRFSPDFRRSLADNWELIREKSLLPATALARLRTYSSVIEGSGDAYETETADGRSKIWWIDPRTGGPREIPVADGRHDVSGALRMVFAVDGKMLSATSIPGN